MQFDETNILNNSELIEAHLRQLSRQPFLELLARVIRCEPSEESLRAHSNKNPDRWAQILAILGRLGGFSDRVSFAGNLSLVNIENMSDMELINRLNELEEQLQKQLPQGTREKQLTEGTEDNTNR